MLRKKKRSVARADVWRATAGRRGSRDLRQECGWQLFLSVEMWAHFACIFDIVVSLRTATILRSRYRPQAL